MKVVYTEEALKDLDAIADWLIVHYPAIAPVIERRIRSVVAHIARWPESSRGSAKRPGVRAVPLGRYPYKIFYRVAEGTVLHIHHGAQQPWDDQA
jgi:plasmid stabilization system protein ParE